MIKINDKTYRNLPEQVEKNKRDIEYLWLRAGFQGPYASTEDIQPPVDGVIYIIGAKEPYELYKFDIDDGFIDLGPFGATGAQGPVGPEGPKGPKGDKGDTGERGPQGIQGPQGPYGLQGPKGDPGSNGAPGPQGPIGPEGPRGEKGEAGPIGPEGPQGPKGEKGDRGVQGPTGLQGPQGDPGPMGPQGLRGFQGPTGLQGEKGDKGDPGPMGPQGQRGMQGPVGPQGEKGDKGPMGPQGQRGMQGPQGIQGEKGDKGDPGDMGPEGPRGMQGPQGIQGEKGDKGPMGPEGPRGMQGPQGIQGEQGPQGEVGPKGPRGPQGPAGKDGLTTSITVNGSTYTQVDGDITLPDFPTVPTNFVTLDTGQTITGEKSFNGYILIDDYNPYHTEWNYARLKIGAEKFILSGEIPDPGLGPIKFNKNIILPFSPQSPNRTVTLATTDDIPSLSGYATESWVGQQGFLKNVTWDTITDKPTFATVATSGSYNDLSDKPYIFPSSRIVDIDSNQTITGIKTFEVVVKVKDITHAGEIGILPDSFDYTVTSIDTNEKTRAKFKLPTSKPRGTVDAPTEYTFAMTDDIPSLEGYATELWVGQQGFLKNVDWNEILNKPTFATVATTGSYNDLADKPTIPTVNDATITFTQGGVSKGTISLNQATDQTIELDAGGGGGSSAPFEITNMVVDSESQTITLTITSK